MKFKIGKNNRGELRAFLSGILIPIEEVGDGIFSEKMLGDGVAIIPEEDVLFAPSDGKVTVVMEETRHAVGLLLDGGTEILLHIGLDTVEMGGDGFDSKVKVGDRVKKGQPIITFDRQKIAAAGHRDVTMMVVTNGEDTDTISFINPQKVVGGETVITK